MAWVSSYDEGTKDTKFLLAPYQKYRKLCSDAPRMPNISPDSAVGLCQRHLLHVWKFVYSLYKSESELPDNPVEEVQQVLRYVFCELNYAALTWTQEKHSVPSVIHCFQRLKQFLLYLKEKLKAMRPRESEETLDFYLRKQFPSLHSDISALPTPPTSTESQLIALVYRLQDLQRDFSLQVETHEDLGREKINSPGSSFETESPTFSPDAFLSAASEPVTPFKPPLRGLGNVEKPTRTEMAGLKSLGEINTRSLLAEMCNQKKEGLAIVERMKEYRSKASTAKGSVNYSIYKDSPLYSGYAKHFVAKKAAVLDFPLPSKTSQSALEDFGNMELLDQGKWVIPEQTQKSAMRGRISEKLLIKAPSGRLRIDSKVTFEPIFEEPERTVSNLLEDPGIDRGKIGDEILQPSSLEEDGKYQELKKTLQELASLATKNTAQDRIFLGRKELSSEQESSSVLGRKLSIRRESTDSHSPKPSIES